MPDAGHDEAYLLSRAEHYGTQTADTVSDLHDTVTGYNLDEFTGWVHAVHDAGDQTVNGVKTLGDRLEMGGNKITTLGNPSANCGDAANSYYVDSGSTYVVRTYEDQSVGGTKHFSSAIADSFKRGTGVSAGTNRGWMTLTSGYGLGHNAWYNLPFDSYNNFIEDNGNLHSGSAFTLPLSGAWALSACVTWPDAGESYYAAMQWFQNPSVIAQETQKFWNNDVMTLSIVRFFAAGSTVTLRLYQDDANSITIPPNSSSTPCWASACFIA